MLSECGFRNTKCPMDRRPLVAGRSCSASVLDDRNSLEEKKPSVTMGTSKLEALIVQMQSSSFVIYCVLKSKF